MTEPQTTITLRGPADVLATLPYHLGYHPRRSVVVVSLHERRVGLVLRADLPPGPPPPAVVDAVVAPVLREGADRVVAVGFEDEPDECLPLLTAAVQSLEAAGVTVDEVIVSRGGRRYSPACSGSCCPPEGVPVPPPAEVPAVAELVALGRYPLPGREAVDLLPAPDAGWCHGVAAALDAVPGRARARPAALRAWARLLAPDPHGRRRGEPPVAPDVLAAAVAGLRDVPLRDALIAWAAPGLLPREQLEPRVVALLERHLPRWAGMGTWRRDGHEPQERAALLERVLGACRCVPDTRAADAAAVCTVAAHLAWADGDGALARAALERALRLAPDYRLAQLLGRLVEHGIRTGVAEGGAGLERAG